MRAARRSAWSHTIHDMPRRRTARGISSTDVSSRTRRAAESMRTREAASLHLAAEAHAPVISLRGVEKSHKAGSGVTYVLRRISLDIAAGEFVTVMGPSGAGKSTLLAILGMLDPMFTGEYFFRGRPV